MIYLLWNYAIRDGYGFCVIILRYFLRESRRLWLARESKKFSFQKIRELAQKTGGL